MYIYRIKILILLVILMFSGGCFTINYTFSGASIHPEAKTASVQYFENRASEIQPGLSQKITDALKEKIESQTNLTLINGIGDMHFEGEITKYFTKPKSITANDLAAENRFTIGIKVSFSNALETELDFEKSFDRYEDYESTKNLEDVREELTELIVEQLIDDIFNEAFANW